jgi:hypothetical protein
MPLAIGLLLQDTHKTGRRNCRSGKLGERRKKETRNIKFQR